MTITKVTGSLCTGIYRGSVFSAKRPSGHAPARAGTLQQRPQGKKRITKRNEQHWRVPPKPGAFSQSACTQLTPHRIRSHESKSYTKPPRGQRCNGPGVLCGRGAHLLAARVAPAPTVHAANGSTYWASPCSRCPWWASPEMTKRREGGSASAAWPLWFLASPGFPRGMFPSGGRVPAGMTMRMA
jgi:hypothetical protein